MILIDFICLTLLSSFCVGVYISVYMQKQPSRGVLRKRCPENMQQVYRRRPMLQCDFNLEGCLRQNLRSWFREIRLKGLFVIQALGKNYSPSSSRFMLF